MTNMERGQILKMVENGKISAEDGLRLMQALGTDPVEQSVEVVEPETGSGSGTESAPETTEAIARMKRFWQIPLWIGIGITVFGGLLMYWVMQKTMGFWFYCSWLPFLLGVSVIAMAVASRTSRWIHIRIQQKPGHKPGRISLSFPIPLRTTAWLLSKFGHNIRGLDNTAVDEVLRALDETTSDAPLYVHVDDDDDGERVQVFIG